MAEQWEKLIEDLNTVKDIEAQQSLILDSTNDLDGLQDFA